MHIQHHLTKKNTNIPQANVTSSAPPTAGLVALKFNNTLVREAATSVKFDAHDVPVFKQVQGRDWVYFGTKNEYPQYLLDLYNRSAKHNAIVNGKAKYVFGSGFGKDGDKIVNDDNETFNDITKKAVLDCELFSGLYFECVWDKGGNSLSSIKHIDFSDIRSNKDNTEFYYTSEWTKKLHDGTIVPISQPEQNKDFKTYPAYNEGNKVGAQIFFYKAYRPGLKTYPLPEYQGAVVHIDIDIQIGDYWNNAIHNGFSAAHLIDFFNGVPTAKEATIIEEQIAKKLTGARSKKFIINFQDKPENATKVSKLEPEDLDRHLQILNQTVQQEIFSGHHVTSPMLFGIKTPGQLGGRTELIEANELFQNIYVTPKQNMFEKVMGILAEQIGIKGELKLGKIEPIGYLFSESTMKDVLPPEAIAEMVAKKMGIDLKKYPTKVLTEPKQPTNFSAEKTILELLKKKGKKRNGTVVKQRPMDVAYIKNVKQSEDELINFAKEEIKINPGIIPIDPNKPLIRKDTGEPIHELRVFYKYAWRDAIPSDQRDTADHPSRDFCVEMMQQSDAGITFTKEDLEGMVNEMDDPFVQNVWENRGGWYTKLGTDIHLPYCRHIWQQIVMIV